MSAGTKQSKAKQSNAKQGKARQGKARQGKAKQSNEGPPGWARLQSRNMATSTAQRAMGAVGIAGWAFLGQDQCREPRCFNFSPVRSFVPGLFMYWNHPRTLLVGITLVVYMRVLYTKSC